MSMHNSSRILTAEQVMAEKLEDFKMLQRVIIDFPHESIKQALRVVNSDQLYRSEQVQGVISWFDFATAIKEIGGYACKINPIPSSAYPVPAKRPHYSILLTDKIETTYNIHIPHWKDSLEKCMQLLK